jgi:hypothetical protein
MIPHEVVVIAEVLALEYKGSAADWERFTDVAYKIYNQLQLEKEAERLAYTAPDD